MLLFTYFLADNETSMIYSDCPTLNAYAFLRSKYCVWALEYFLIGGLGGKKFENHIQEITFRFSILSPTKPRDQERVRELLKNYTSI